jgi:hypothetical protein
MTRISKEQLVTTPATLNYLSESAYDHTKWNLGKGLIYNNGATAVDKYISPDFQAIRPLEESTPFAVTQIYAHNHSATITYVFGVEALTTAVATRRVQLWELNRKTGARSWKGFITMTLLTATAHTVRNFTMDVKEESTGTVAVSGTTVTGTGTAFATNKVAVGARIGFGSTDPGQITEWYRVTVRTSNTALTLNVTPGTITAGTAYVIQEFRPVYTATNATTTNGGTHYGKGISIEDFTSGGTTIPVAVSTDDQKAMYWIKDASTQTNIAAAGVSLERDTATATSLNMYVLDLVSAGNYRVYKYNIRAALTVATGASVSAWILTTGNQAVTGTGSQNANLCIANTSHGLGNGIKSIYFVTTTRWYRAALSNITSGNVSWQSNVIAEIPTGGTSTFAATGGLSTIEYMPSIDSFVIGTTSATGNFSYVSKYVSSGNEFDRQFGRDYKHQDQSLMDNGHPTIFSNQILPLVFTDAGANRIFVCKQGTTALNNQIYVMAFGSDWEYAANSQGRLISPEITTPNVLKYYRVFANHVDYLGSTTLGKTTESYRMYARTANITSDETTGWTLIDGANDISGLAGASSIQFAIEFKTIGESCVPARILGLNLSYEDNTSDSHYSLSVEKSSVTSKIFAWYFDSAFGGTVPTLRINLYDANSGGLLLTDTTTAAANGTWEKTTDGTSWIAYDTTDRANTTTWIRYTPTSLADNIKVEAYLQQA